MRTLLTSFILAYFFSSANGQSFYVKVSGGYAFPLASEYIGEKRSSIYLRETDPQSGNYVPAFIQENQIVKGSYTSGMTASGTAGYMLTEIIALEINLSYSAGKQFRSSAIHQDIIDDQIINTSDASTVSRAKTFIIAPSISLTALKDSKLSPFISAGPAISFSNLESNYERASDFADQQSSKRHEKYSGGISIGFRSTIGLELKLNDRLSLFSEAAILVLSYYPREKETTKYEVNDEDLLSTLSESERRTIFVKSYHSDTRTGADASTRPSKELKSSFEMNSIAVLTGLKISL